METFHGLDPDFFLKFQWQQKPAFFPGGLGDFPLPINQDWFFRLAADKRLVSRLVRAGTHFQVEYGPFTNRFLRHLPNQDWMLLVSETDRVSPSIHRLKNLLTFLPTWRQDDIMISYGVPGGTVGPHVDEYDVFLIQLEGEKRWRITNTPLINPGFRKGEELKILRQFRPDAEFLCRSGDVLYLPPGIGHEGVSTTAGFTISIGFRAPSLKEGLPQLADLLSVSPNDWRFTDKGRQNSKKNHLLAEPDQERLRNQLLDFSRSDEYRHWMGRILTEPKRGFRYKKQEIRDFSDLRVDSLEWAPGVRRLILDGAPPFLYIEGNCFFVPLKPTLQTLILNETILMKDLPSSLDDPEIVRHLILWYRQGWLVRNPS